MTHQVLFKMNCLALSLGLATLTTTLFALPLRANPVEGGQVTNLHDWNWELSDRPILTAELKLDDEVFLAQVIAPSNFPQTPILPETVPPSLAPLPEIEPTPTISPTQASPPSPTPTFENPAVPTPPPGSVPETIIVESFEVRGSTVFTPEEFAQVTEPFTNRPLSLEEVFQVAEAVTQLYNSQGYINSGAFIPPHETLDDIVIIQVLEGGLEAINVTGTRRLRPDYIRSRLALGTSTPLNINRLIEALQLLRLDPLIEGLSTELSASPRPGLSVLEVQVREADSFDLRLVADNGRSPSVGTFRRGAGFTEGNLLGFGDELQFDYANTDGSDSFDVGYTFPVNARNGTLRFLYGTRSNDVIESPFTVLEIESESRYYELTYRQPIIQTPSQEFTLGLMASRQEAETSLLDFAFPLSAGADNEGRLRVSAVRFFQEWLKRDAQQVISARSQLSFGVDAFDATLNDGEIPDSRFLAWRFQGQWVRLLAEDTLLVMRTDGQVANDSLVVLEQFRLGGIDSVRGYRQDLLLTDNGLFISGEVRIPILRISEWGTLVQLTPFIDYGKGWNQSGVNPSPNQLASIGLGLQWQQGRRLTARFGWGLALVDVELDDRTLQEQGFYFSIRYSPF